MKRTVTASTLPPRRFRWPWPRVPTLSTVRPVRGSQFHLSGRHRVFLLEHDEWFDQIPWGGLALMRADNVIREEARPRMIALYLLHLMRHHLREYRSPLGGLLGSYRKGEHHPATSALLGACLGRALSRLYGDAARTAGYDQRDFRRRLGRRLSGLNAGHEHGSLPIGIAAVFRLPPYDASRASSVERIIGRLEEQVLKWHAGKRRPSDMDKWLSRVRSEPRRSILRAERSELACAIAYATWMAHACWYPYALANFAERINPPLDCVEETIFWWYHWSRDLVGIPLQCIRRDYWDLVAPTTQDLLAGRIGTARAKREIHRALELHGWLVEEAQDVGNVWRIERRDRLALKQYATELSIQAGRSQERHSNRA